MEFFNGATKLGEDTSAPYAFSWANVAAGAYAITAKATDNAGATTTSAVVNMTVNAAPVCTLPAGWASQDIGSPGQVGSACESGGVWTVRGGGADIWNSSDQFRFAYQSANVPTNATIVARVTSVQNTNTWAKAGVMFRDGTAANARFVMVVQMPNNEVTMQWRTTAGGSAAWTGARGGRHGQREVGAAGEDRQLVYGVVLHRQRCAHQWAVGADQLGPHGDAGQPQTGPGGDLAQQRQLEHGYV